MANGRVGEIIEALGESADEIRSLPVDSVVGQRSGEDRVRGHDPHYASIHTTAPSQSYCEYRPTNEGDGLARVRRVVPQCPI